MSPWPAVAAAIVAVGLAIAAVLGGGEPGQVSVTSTAPALSTMEWGLASVPLKAGRFHADQAPSVECPPGLACAQPVGRVLPLEPVGIPDFSTLTIDVSGIVQLNETQMRAVLWQAGWPPEWHDEALAIAWCESRWQPGATGDGGAAHGLFQVHTNDRAWRSKLRGDPFDAVANSRLALYVRKAVGRWGSKGGWARCSAGAGIW